ncbi:MAG: hypothetical protein RSE14_10725 [Erythrobacter sp.]|nr:hypothetical protein [Erythrobacter sp.]WRH69749.1 MAG: hypothetical protein RSE14_10725 [Erythrobacter sp.]
MNRAIALPLAAAAANRFDATEVLRQLVVLGCAAALILAQHPLPF